MKTYEQAIKDLLPMYCFVDKTVVDDGVINAAIDFLSAVAEMYGKTYSEILSDLRGINKEA